MLAALVTESLERRFAQLGTTNRLEMKMIGSDRWWLGDPTGPAFHAAEAAVTRHWKTRPLFIREGGTTRSTSFLEDITGAPALHFPMGQVTMNIRRRHAAGKGCVVPPATPCSSAVSCVALSRMPSS